MSPTEFSRLCERATNEGVETEELSVTKTEDGYRLSVGEATYTGLSADALRDIFADNPAYLREWWFWHHIAPQNRSQWTFLRWIENADTRGATARRDALSDGVEQRWGQLLVSVTLDEEDTRRYEIRHVEDGERRAEELEEHVDSLDARRLAKYDDDGRYRPLSTAPTLQTGWIFSDLDAEATVRTVDFFYPATIANWYRERMDTLDVTHWVETTDRQTGIYDVTQELRGAAVDWVAEACCVDSQCLKRRQWDEHADRTLSVPRGNGAFPCREPCSLVIAAARKWALIEREEEQEYQFQLTPSEKKQLETLLDAVAEGRIADIREADLQSGANRYRARFLRAKRTDDQGRLREISSEEE